MLRLASSLDFFLFFGFSFTYFIKLTKEYLQIRTALFDVERLKFDFVMSESADVTMQGGIGFAADDDIGVSALEHRQPGEGKFLGIVLPLIDVALDESRTVRSEGLNARVRSTYLL